MVSGPQKILRFNVPGAKGVAVGDSNGSSDPYCKVILCDGNKHVLASVQTEAKKKTLDPVWDHNSLNFQLSDDLIRLAKVVRLEVWDQDVGAKV